MSIRKIIVLVGALLTMTACGGNQADNDISSDESFSSQVDSSPQASSEAASSEQVSSEPVHSHTYSGEWSHDGIYHWHGPTCGDTSEVKDKAEHIFGDWVVDTEPAGSKEGSRHKTCAVCGYTITETFSEGVYEINNDSISLDIDETYQLKVKKNGKDYVGVTWSSTDSNIASVSSSGLVNGRSKGKATIKALINETLTLTCKVTVNEAYLSDVFTVSRDHIEAIVGEKTNYPTIYKNGSYYVGITAWNYDDTYVTLSNDAIIGEKAGTTKIKATVQGRVLEFSVVVYESVADYFVKNGTKTVVGGVDWYYFEGTDYVPGTDTGVVNYGGSYTWGFLYNSSTKKFSIQTTWDFTIDGNAIQCKGRTDFQLGKYKEAINIGTYIFAESSSKPTLQVQFDNSCITYKSNGYITIEDSYRYVVIRNDFASDVTSYDCQLMWHAVQAGHNFATDDFFSERCFNIKLFE